VAFAGTKAMAVTSQYRQADALVRIWDLATAKEERRWGEDAGVTVSSATLAAGGRFAITGGTPSPLMRWHDAKD
jgi:hypothetical protein